MLSAEIIAIGSELLTPSKTDTNSLWLTEKLNDIGVAVRLKTVVGDDERRLEEVIRNAVSRSDIVITTGGLGPTEDDITRKTSAKALDRELVFKEELVNELRKKFRAFGKEMPERNIRQAFVIKGAKVLPNPHGTAVGMLTEIGAKFLVVLPGPPRELKPMFVDFILPRLTKIAGEFFVRRKSLKVSGMGESLVDELIAPIYTKYENPQTTILFNKSEVEIQLTAQGKTKKEADSTISNLADQIVKKLGRAVFTANGETMEEVISKILLERNETLAIAESCTGGLISQRLTDVPGSSRYFVESAVTYANEAKINMLGVPEKLIEEFGAVSGEVAESMAKGVRKLAKTDYAASVTGIAGPGGGTDTKPVGTVFLGYADSKETCSKKIKLPGDRHLIRWRSSQAALDYLRRKVLDKQ